MNFIYNTVEVKDRDLISKLFFIGENINNKYFFFIGDKLAISRAVKSFGPGYYMYKSINKNDTRHIKKIKNLGSIYLSLDEEGGYALNNNFFFKSFLKYRSSKTNMKLVDKVFTWGDFDNHCWKKEYKNFHKKIFKTGAPRTDLWKKKIYSKVFKIEIENLQEKYGKFLFIPSTFYSSKNDLDNAIKEDKKIKKNETLISKKNRIKAKRNDFYQFVQFTKLIKKLSLHYPKKNIVIKPHPTENIKNWYNYFDQKKYKNVFFDNNHNVTSYVAACECVIFNSSSVGMQAVIMNKKAISFVNDKKDSFRSYPNKCVPQTKSFFELTKLIDKKKFKYEKKFVNRVRSRFLINKSTASKRIMKEIKKLTIKPLYSEEQIKQKLKIIPIKYKFIDLLKSSLSKVKKTILKKKENYYQGYSRKLGGGIQFSEIKKFFNMMNLNNKLIVKKFCRNGFVIYRRY